MHGETIEITKKQCYLTRTKKQHFATKYPFPISKDVESLRHLKQMLNYLEFVPSSAQTSDSHLWSSWSYSK